MTQALIHGRLYDTHTAELVEERDYPHFDGQEYMCSDGVPTLQHGRIRLFRRVRAGDYFEEVTNYLGEKHLRLVEAPRG